MFSVREQQILRQIEDGLRADDRGFSRRFALRLGALRCAAPLQRRGVLAVAGAALLLFAVLAAAAAAVRTLVAFVRIARHSAAVVFKAILAKACPSRGGSVPQHHLTGRPRFFPLRRMLRREPARPRPRSGRKAGPPSSG